jgi:hypothetical protein
MMQVYEESRCSYSYPTCLLLLYLGFNVIKFPTCARARAHTHTHTHKADVLLHSIL